MKLSLIFPPQHTQKTPFVNHKGFTLIELMVAVVIVVITIAGVTSSFQNFIKHGSTNLHENETNSAIEATFQLLKRDLNMAGFGLTAASRLAENNHFATTIEQDFTSAYRCNGDSDSNDPITETCCGYDLDGDGTLNNNMFQDRLFIADGWTILKDVTINGWYDGKIQETPTDYFYKVANKKENGGYYAQTIGVFSSGANAVTIDNSNINFGDEVNTGVDFVTDGAVILNGEDGSGNLHLEGQPIGNVAGSSISFQAGNSLANNYVTTPPTKVVPANIWYVAKKAGDSTFWLYRNADKVLPGVIGFQASFGYDIAADGMQWYQTVPPSVGQPVDSLTMNNASFTQVLKGLKAVRVVFTLVRQGNNQAAIPTMRTYEKTIILKN